jgi:long-subunit acyl-CoA synthetase (AMP-forming)
VSTVVSVDKVVKLHADDIHLSYLPLAHVFERCVVHTVSLLSLL